MFREHENRYQPLTIIENSVIGLLCFGIATYLFISGFSWLKVVSPVLMYIGILIRHKNLFKRLNYKKRTGFELLFLVVGVLLLTFIKK